LKPGEEATKMATEGSFDELSEIIEAEQATVIQAASSLSSSSSSSSSTVALNATEEQAIREAVLKLERER